MKRDCLRILLPRTFRLCEECVMVRPSACRRAAGWTVLLVTLGGLSAAMPAQPAPQKEKEKAKQKDGKAHPANRLAQESSPYLRQHAHNPVDWHPWGPEAFAKAKKENKLVFL